VAVVEYRVDGHAAIITINRPEARNAIDPEIALGIEESIDRIEADPAVWVGILSAVPPVFSAGADLKILAAGRGGEIVTPRGGFAGIVRRERRKPMIAAVDGPALAGGTEIVLACDLVVASTAAVFGIPEVKRGLTAGAGALFRMPRKIPFNIAMECALTGDPLTVETAARFGMVNHLCEAGTALDHALELAGRIAANAPLAVWESRRIMLQGAYADDSIGWELTADGFATLLKTADVLEGIRAFTEKRAPVWEGA
jgi:enoyl-CoA hydratase